MRCINILRRTLGRSFPSLEALLNSQLRAKIESRNIYSYILSHGGYDKLE